MIILVIDSPSMFGKTAMLEALMTIEKKVVVVSTSENKLPKDYIVDDFIRPNHELLIQRFDDFILTQNDYEYIDLDLPVKYIVSYTFSPIGTDIIKTRIFNPSTPIRGTPCYNYN